MSGHSWDVCTVSVSVTPADAPASGPTMTEGEAQEFMGADPVRYREDLAALLDESQRKVAELETRLCGGDGATKYDRIDVLEARVAELEGELHVARHCIDVDAKAIQDCVDLQTQLDRSTKRIDELEEAALIALDRIAQVDSSLPLYVVAARNVLSHVLSEERRDEMIDRIGILQAQLDRATSEVEELSKVDDAHGYKAQWLSVRGENGRLRDELDRKPAEPRPMSEAPRTGVLRVVADVYWSRAHGEWMLNGIDGWLPTSSDEETTAAGGSECIYEATSGLDELDGTQIWKCRGCGDETGMPMTGRQCRAPGGSGEGE